MKQARAVCQASVERRRCVSNVTRVGAVIESRQMHSLVPNPSLVCVWVGWWVSVFACFPMSLTLP